MTTLPQSREYERVSAALRYVANRWWWVNLAKRLAVWLTATLLGVLTLAAVAAAVPLGSGIRWAMLLAMTLAPALGLVAAVWPMRRRLTPAQAARQIEQHVAGLENRFINAVQLADDGHLYDRELVGRTLDEIARHTSDAPVDDAVRTRGLGYASLAVIAAVAITLAGVMLAGDRLAFGMDRILHPGSQSWVGDVKLDAVRPGDTTVLAGERLAIEADVSADRRLDVEPEAQLWIRREGEADFSPLAMRIRRPLGGSAGGATGSYFFVFPAVDRAFDYYVSVGTTNHSDSPHRITVRHVPQVAGLAVTVDYPAYLDHVEPAGSVTEGLSGDFEAPVGSTATVRVTTNSPVVAAELSVLPTGDAPAQARTIAMGPAGVERTEWTAALPVDATVGYRIVFRDQHGQVAGTLPASTANAAASEDTGQFTVTARPDLPPTAQILRPGSDSYVAPGGQVEMRLQASDEHGLSRVRLMAARVRPNGPAGDDGQLATERPTVRHEWAGVDLLDEKGRPRTLARITYTFDLRQMPELAEDDRVVYWLTATDNRDLSAAARRLGLADAGPQSAESARYVLTVQDPAKLLEQRKKILQQLTEELTKLLREQKTVRGQAVALVHDELAGEAWATAAGTVKAGQFAFADHLMRLAKGKIVAFDAETKSIQISLLTLAYNDSADARTRAEAVTDLPDAVSDPEPIKQLVAMQDRVIYALESLLGLIGRAVERAEDESSRTAGTDLPPDVQGKLRNLSKDLEKFIEQQKRVIDVTQTLAKKPVDDFSDKDLTDLEDLVAQQEKWEKFLDEQIKDFSKLAEQDFSNPTLLKELIEIKTDVVMAKDALQNKAVEIAVPIEEAGLEMAEETVANIEKWLPDTPDREKWSMEEPTEQHDVPMAELPKELEDLMGPLMEAEEDLFEDIEDATSKWTDSLDKGAGWDAVDGPISNMSAKGVTGNRLPNTSEISGRSGEGRTGKSSGEMVEDEATGKGGRRTPTRLSSDPFQKGQVKDSSKEPPGGATGGGKLAGVAGEGLEGPVPPEVQKKLQRLAQKQAAIRNRAEAVDARFRANNFNNFALQKAITIMRQVEMDLENNRYQNALRKRAVMVNNLQAQQMLLRGEIHVQADESPDLPDVVRTDVRNVDDTALPSRYKDLAKQYLQDLSEGE